MTDCINMDERILSSPAWRFKMLQGAHRAAVDAVLSRHGARAFAQPFILFLLLRFGEDGSFDTQRELAERMRVSPATITASLKLLEKQGCVERVSDANDLRRKQIRITAAGRDAAKRCMAAFAEVDEAMYRGFSPEELDRLSNDFSRIAANLTALSEGGGTQ